MRIATQPSRRQGAFVVEFAFVAMILILIIFGIFEYSRFLFVKQVVHASAREGARYAVVNSTGSTLVTDTQAKVLERMSGLSSVPNCNYKCQVYLSDSNGNNIGNAMDAAFGQYIAVQIDYDFTPILPVLLGWTSPMHITAKAMMYSEAN